eukprot:2745696-Prymnesium_polylepis.1
MSKNNIHDLKTGSLYAAQARLCGAPSDPHTCGIQLTPCADPCARQPLQGGGNRRTRCARRGARQQARRLFGAHDR